MHDVLISKEGSINFCIISKELIGIKLTVIIRKIRGSFVIKFTIKNDAKLG